MAKKTTPEPALTADEKTMLLIRQLKQQKAEIEAAERPQWNTNCSYRSTPACTPVNVQVVASVNNLIEIAAELIARENSYVVASTRLGVDAPPFRFLGFSLQEWLNDIQTRVNKLQLTAKQQKYDALETRLNAIVSPELRAQMELKAIEDDLAKI